MQNDTVLTSAIADHSGLRAPQVGFHLSDLDVEQRRVPAIGPSSTPMLRDTSTLWPERMPAINCGGPAHSLRLGTGARKNCRLIHATNPIGRFGFDDWCEERRALDGTIARLVRLPEWIGQAHQRFLDAHRRQVAALEEENLPVAAIAARLACLHHPRTVRAANPSAPIRTIERTLRRRHDRLRSPRLTHDLVLSEDQIRRAHVCRFPFGIPAGGRVSAVS